MINRYVRIAKTDAATRDVTDFGYGFRRGEYAKPGKSIETGGYVLEWTELDPETEGKVTAELENRVVEDHYYRHESDDIHDVEYTSEGVEIISLSSIADHVIVEDSAFHGIVIRVSDTGGNGWSGISQGRYGIFFTDGTIVGSNQKSYSFSGEDSDKTERDTYYLKRKDSAKG